MNDKEQEMFHLKQKEDLTRNQYFRESDFPGRDESKLRKHEMYFTFPELLL